MTSATPPKRFTSQLKTYARDDERTGYEGNLTPQQDGVLAELKKWAELSEFAEDIKQNPDGDRFLLRFLRATMADKSGNRVFNLSKAKDRLIATLEFRRKWKVDEIRKMIEEGAPPPEGYERYAKDVRPSYAFIDKKTGRRVHIERMGALTQMVDTNAFSLDVWIRFFVWDCEAALKQLRDESKRRGHEVGTQITIIDERLTGMGIVSRLTLFKEMNNVASIHYPEMLSSIFIVYAPRIFSAIFSVVKTVLDQDTASKLIVTSGLPVEELTNLMDTELLPKEFGGEADVEVPITIYARPKKKT